MDATRNGRYEVAKTLLNAGADVNAQDAQGNTAVTIAMKRKQKDFIDLLEEYGARLEPTENENSAAAGNMTGMRRDYMLSLPNYAGDGIDLDAWKEDEPTDFVKQYETNPDATDEDGNSLIAIAALQNDFESVRQLMERGIDTRRENKDGYDAIDLTWRKRKFEIAMLLANGSEQLLVDAVKRADFNAVKRLVGKGWPTDYVQNHSNRRSILHFAAEVGHVGIVYFLLQQKTNVDLKDRESLTPLYFAIDGQHAKCAEMLLEAGANPLESKDSSQMLHKAIDMKNMQIATTLLERGVSVNAVDDLSSDGTGETPLERACRLGLAEFIVLLLDHSADTAPKKNTSPLPVLVILVKAGNSASLRRLIKHNLSLDVIDERGRTALHYACELGFSDIALILLDAGASPNLEDYAGETPLSLALKRSQIEIQTLLTNHPLVDQKDLREIRRPCWWLDGERIAMEKQPFATNGSFGAAHFGKWKGIDVVVKVLKTDTNDNRDKLAHSFHHEIRVWNGLQHENVIRLHGFCELPAGNTFLFVCEKADKGDLSRYLQERKEMPMSLLWKLLKETAQGLKFLHNRKVVHGDLKCNNVLVSGEKCTAKVADFGLGATRGVIESQNIASHTGAIQWVAPECLKGHPTSFESDVYSLGMCVLEANSGRTPWGWLSGPAVKKHVLEGKQPDRSEHESVPDEVWNLVQRMCAFNPADRPKLDEVISTLAELEGSDKRMLSSLQRDEVDCGFSISLRFTDQIVES